MLTARVEVTGRDADELAEKLRAIAGAIEEGYVVNGDSYGPGKYEVTGIEEPVYDRLCVAEFTMTDTGQRIYNASGSMRRPYIAED
jgi:hypothetical protein